MKEKIQKSNEDKLLKEKELTEEQMERLLDVKISQGNTLDNVKRFITSLVWLRFIVSNNFDVLIDTSNDHDGIMKDNAIEAKDCVIDNGLLRADDDGCLIFSYQSSPMTILHIATEKKIIQFFERNGIKLSKDYKHAHAYD